jgi:dynein heavy chain, axonemal
MDDMRSISKAGNGLLKFVQAVLKYCDTYREVKPKQDRVEFLQNDLEEKSKVLEHLKLEVERLENELGTLNAKYEQSQALRQKYSDELDISEKRLNAADRLVTDLMSEKRRWIEELKRLGVEKESIVGTCLLSASFLAYCGAFSWDFRKAMIDDWLGDIIERDIPVASPYRANQNLSDDVEICAWSSEGLPPDELSIQNGILTTRSSRFPLCIDPQQQALRWIQKRENHNNLRVMSFNDSDFLKHLEVSVRFGIPVLFQDIDDYVDPVIGNLLEKKYRTQSGQSFVLLGDKEVDVDANFRLYLTTKLSNPTLDPSIYAKAVVINYAVTVDGLEDQLLSVVVREERFDLEEQREMLIEETSINKNLLSVYEDSLLRELSNSTGNMLDNENLIETLDNTKSKAAEVLERLRSVAKTSADIEETRNGYRPVAKRGAILFFVLSELPLVSSMYQYSLAAYMLVFKKALHNALSDVVIEVRLNNILQTLTKSVYDYGCTGLFEKHKLLFSFQMTIKLQQSVGEITRNELEFFIRGSVSLEKLQESCPAKWLCEKGWKDFVQLANDFPEAFGEALATFKASLAEWKEWYDYETPEVSLCPSSVSPEVSMFQKMMLLRCFRPDRVFRAMNLYVIETMSEDFITPPVVDFKAICDETAPQTPVVIILSPGQDPTDELMKLAAKTGMLDRFSYISLGQGQEEAALRLLKNSIEQGHWLMLQNGHLLIPFMKRLEKIFEAIEDFHKDFRLWITTDPVDDFPIGILQMSLKVVTESPNGLKLNLRSTFFKMQSDVLESCQHEAFGALVYMLAFFNAVVLERRKYDKLGFNINYDFNESDFNVCLEILKTYLTTSERVPWSSLKYLIGEVSESFCVVTHTHREIFSH